MTKVQTSVDNWFVNHLPALETFMRVSFGIVWIIDGALKFEPGFSMIDTIRSAAQSSPSWLAPWFNFWINLTNTAPPPVGAIEILLGIALILGFLRKIVYILGFLYSLLVWSVPEAFGGPYVAGVSTDIGTGIIYAFVFFLFMIANAALGQSKMSLDYIIEEKFPSWRRLAEIRGIKFG